MFTRKLFKTLESAVKQFPAVALLGPRQVGKTTLAFELKKHFSDSIYLDLESEQDLAKLNQPELYLKEHTDKLVILDEVHRAPGLFPILRGLIDSQKRAGKKTSQYLLLGSASPDLLKQSGESLAGRIAYLELTPLLASEIEPKDMESLWLRGGFPDSFLADSEEQSVLWRQNFIRTYLERDVPQFAPRISTETLRRFWGMLSNAQGTLINVAQLAGNLGIDQKTAQSYMDLLIDLLMVRKLQPWHSNIGKRLVKSPKVYVRDSGLVHSLLSISNKEALLSHPIIGQSWEAFIIENLTATLPNGAIPYFYKTSGGAEIDLIIAWPNQEIWAIEIKRSLQPKVEKGFHQACIDLEPKKKFVVYAGQERFSLGHDVEAISLLDLSNEIKKHVKF
jgi:predicted AAA+ superfamily ATPase